MNQEQREREYSQRFYAKAGAYKAGPSDQRACHDICCLVFFGLLFLVTIGGGAYFIHSGISGGAINDDSGDYQDSPNIAEIIRKTAPAVTGMIALSAVLSFVYILLAKSFPKCLTYSMIAITFLVYIGLIIVGIVFKIYILAIVFAVVLLFKALILWCCWERISMGIVLLSCSGTFITEKPTVYLISMLCLVFNVLYAVFWIFSWIGVSFDYINSQSNNNTVFQVLYYIWYADAIFFAYFLYYCMVFLVAVTCACWYYQKADNSVMKGFSYIRYHLGSITFASVVITIITIIRMIANNSNNGNGIIRLIACLIQCLLSCIQGLLKALNHNAVIVMAVTGEGYIDAAKSAVGLIFDNLGLYIIIEFFTRFIGLYAAIVCVLVPAVLGGVIVYFTENSTSGNQITYAIWGGVFILLISYLVSIVVLGMLEESLSCLFIFFSYDCSLRAQGIPVNNIPEEIRNEFDSVRSDYALKHSKDESVQLKETMINRN